MSLKNPALLCGLIAIALAGQWLFSAYGHLAGTLLAPPAAPMENPASDGLKLLGGWFGDAASGAPLAPSASEFNIKGIVTGDQEHSSYVIIGEPGKEETIYKENDRLPDGSVITAITPGRVTLKTAGGERSLSLPE